MLTDPLLRGKWLSESEELQPKFIDAMDHAGRPKHLLFCAEPLATEMANTALTQALKAPSDSTAQMGSYIYHAPNANSRAYRKIVQAAVMTPTKRDDTRCVSATALT